ncbi:hypothetical protein GOHSU_04_02280 [Gordonia hirsuta DSM 44140 = NBRC 16056]|uniref:Uncharacterized protein n=1 Tax=Gordonia hirsuta DSM 44140 = NBRC 16056 TaxID=1121927 RepID=L7L8J8_9ACTN|nr:hypothetical protein [Gordonia hirsuta]GAC56358.1 hypothetical protein GOHSU_04_02280 [Gordonia hirsuta DSM 44140 = NBRC 16056]
MTSSDTESSTEEKGSGSPQKRRFFTRRNLVTRQSLWAVAGVCVIAVLATLTWFTATSVGDDRDRDRLDEQYLSTARHGVRSLISVNSANADEDVDRILENATGDFRSDFSSRADDFIKVVKQMDVSSEGTVNAAGIESSDEDKAVVLVSATSLVTNGAGAQEEPRVWRLRVHLVHTDDRVLIEKVDYAV